VILTHRHSHPSSGAEHDRSEGPFDHPHPFGLVPRAGESSRQVAPLRSRNLSGRGISMNTGRLRQERLALPREWTRLSRMARCDLCSDLATRRLDAAGRARIGVNPETIVGTTERMVGGDSFKRAREGMRSRSVGCGVQGKQGLPLSDEKGQRSSSGAGGESKDSLALSLCSTGHPHVPQGLLVILFLPSLLSSLCSPCPLW
jgi:hypothetical protein